MIVVMDMVGVVEAAMCQVVVLVVVVMLCWMVVAVLLAPAQHRHADKADTCELELHLLSLAFSLCCILYSTVKYFFSKF